MPRTSPRSSEISFVFDQAYTPNKKTRITRPMGKASRLWDISRTVCQEVAANAKARAQRITRAARQTPRSRRGNWSRSSRAEEDSAGASARGVKSLFISKLCRKASPDGLGTLEVRLACKLWLGMVARSTIRRCRYAEVVNTL